MRILIVDDDVISRKLLRLLVENRGHSVIEASDGQEGLEKARTHKPEAIISDALMPKMDGFEFLRAVRQDETLRAIPFVFHTGIYTEDKESELALLFGADALIVKPKTPDAFWKEFTTALEVNASRKETDGKVYLNEKEEERFRDYCRIVAAKLEEKVRELEETIKLQQRTENDRRNMEKALQASSDEWRNTFDVMSEAIALMDMDGKILRCNKAMANLVGKQFHEIIGKQCWDVVHGASDCIANCPLQTMKDSHKCESLILPMGNRWFEVKAEPFFDSEGNLLGAVHIISDITERKELEDALKGAVVRAEDEKAKSDSILEAIGDGLTIQDRNFRVLYQNQSAKKMIGDHIGELCYMAYENREQRCEGCPVAMVFEDGGVHTVVRSVSTEKGIIYFENTASPLLDSKGKIIAGIEVVHDITARKKSEEVLRASEEMHRLIFKNSPVGIFRYDNKLKITDSNNRFVEILKTQREKLISLDMRTLTDQSVIPALEAAIAGKEGQYEGFYKATTSSAEIWVSMRTAPFFSQEGAVKGGIGIVEDITGRKMLEEQLSQISREWEETFNTITDMVTVHDKDFNIIRANKAAQKILGLPFLEVKKVKCFEYFHGTGCPSEGCPSCQSLVTGRPSHFELFEPHLNMFIEIQAIPRLDSNDQVVGLIHVVRDISERKKAEGLLKEERNKAQKYLDVAGVMIVALDSGGRVALINNKGLEILGYEEQEVMNCNWFDLCIPASVREEVKGFHNKLMAGDIGLIEYYQSSVLTKDGHERIIALHNTILRNETGEMTGILFSGEDITEQRQKSDELYERVHQAALGAEIGVALTRGGDLQTTLQLCAEAMVLHLEAAFARIWTLNERENVLELQASAGMYTHINGAHGRVPVGMFKIGLIAQERKPHLSNHVIGDPRVGDQEWAIKEGMVAFAGYPLIVQDRLVGVMAMFSRRQIQEATMSSLASVADVIALGIERKRTEEALFLYSNELTSLNMASDTLMLITNLRDIYKEICNIIYTVFELKMVWLGVIKEATYEVNPVAFAGQEDSYLSEIKVTWDDSPTGMGPTGMSIKTKKSYASHVTDAEYAPWREAALQSDYVSSLAVPLIYARDKCIGALNFHSNDADYFTSDRVRLCQIFANQAAIAIENARLVEELEGKVQERTRRLEDANMELHVVNQELVLRRAEADAASSSKTDFLSNMSHELRTPLNAILGFSEIMQTGMAGPVTDKQKEFLSDIYTSGNHLLSLITDILDLSKIEAGKTVLEPETFTLKELIEASLIMFKEKTLKHAIKVTTDIDSTITEITADKRKLKQVVMNLLSNAFKFTPDSGSVQITARKIGSSEDRMDEASALPRFRTDGDFVEISVTDTGIGISEENQQKLFQPFQQIETSLTRKFAGTGLGLSLCRRFVELHGGRIWVESEPGKGSRFVFVIPMKQPIMKEEI